MLGKLKAIARKENYLIYSRPYELNIWGVRSENTRSGKFDDHFHVFYKTEKNKWEYHIFPCTTDPGTFWLENPMQPQGTAILMQGQYKGAYQIGLHRGQYASLVQRKPVTILRDYDRNAVLDFLNGKRETGLFGINIHRAMQQGKTKYVDKFSAGCQVFENAAHFYRFMQMAERHRSLYGNSFTYTLIDERALKRAFLRRVLYGSLATVAAISTSVYLLSPDETFKQST
ncbi:MAG: hypothetical protein IT233_12575 [Bacteroidia bacterium]|nr:hypothetical protein [Bacteroidia bacterium]